MDRTIRQGGVVEVNDHWLRIEKLGIRTTYGVTANGKNIMIPNATVTQAVISSLTRDNRLIRIETSIMVTYSADLTLVKNVLENTVENLEWLSQEQEAKVLVAEFTRLNVVFDVLVWIDDLDHARERKSDLNEALWQSLKSAGIELASS